MKHFVSIFVLVAFVAAILLTCSRGGAPEAALTEQAVAEAVAAWTESWNTYDLNAVDELFLQSESLTYFSSEKEGVIRGIESVREHHAGFGFVPGGKEQGNKLRLEDTMIDLFGTAAVVTAIWYFQREGEPADTAQKGPVTIVYTLSGGKPLIAHMNFSNYEAETK